MGVKVLLLEDTPVAGGMLANGISNIDSYSYESLSGVFEEFRYAVRAHYQRELPGDPFFQARKTRVLHPDGRSRAAHEASEGGRWEPRVAAQIFRKMIGALPGVEVWYSVRFEGVVMEGKRIAGLRVKRGAETLTVCGTVVVDATHEGDIAAWAGAPYRVGREARSRLEPHAGQIYYFNGTGEILPGSTGQADAGIPSSGYRLTVQSVAGRKAKLLERPAGYDAAEYRLAPCSVSTSVPNRKFEVNVNPVGSELPGANWGWPEAGLEDRQRLAAKYRQHALGFLYHLQTACGRTDLELAQDEYADNGNVPYRMFLREGRRIEGRAMMSEADVNPFLAGQGWRPPLRADSIAVGHYPLDAKPVRAKTDDSQPDKGEGDFYLANVSAPFQVPYGAILPREVEGLLVPVALSATHVAFSAVRMDPTWTVTGQAAGVAAAMSVRRGIPPALLKVEELQEQLLKQRIRLAFYWDLPLDHPDFAALQTLSLRGWLEGYPDRTIKPDQPLTRGEAAALLVRAFNVWPSISDIHFSDIPTEHWAFRAVETLHDHGLLTHFNLPPLWPAAGGYRPREHWEFLKPKSQRPFDPARPVQRAEWCGAINQLAGRAACTPGVANRSIPRGEAARELLQYSGRSAARSIPLPSEGARP